MTGGKKLAVNVTVGGDTYEAGTVPPAEVADQISNPKAWGDEPSEQPNSTSRKASSKAPAKSDS